MPSFSKKSKDRLTTVSWDLQRVLQEVVKHHDCTILEGHRGEYKQNQLFKDGKSQVEWPDGKHNSYPSLAVDVAPYPLPEKWGDLRSNKISIRDLEWKERVKFYQLGAVIIMVGSQLGVHIRWGADWDMDGDYKDNKFDDLVHFELL